MSNFLQGIFYSFLIDIIPNLHFWTLRKAFYKMCGMKIGKNSRILRKTVVISPKNVVLGRNVYINEFCYVDGRGGVEIDDNASISVFSYINTGYHEVNKPDFDYAKKPVKIGKNTFVGAHSKILAGSVLEDGVVLCAGSVTKSGTYEARGIYSGVPAKKISERNEDAVSYELGKWKPWFR